MRAGLAGRPETYPWSSHRAYIGHETIPWLAAEEVLGQLSSQLGRARGRFMEFVDDRLDQGHREEFYGKESLDARIIGEDRFVTETLEQMASLPERKPTLGKVLAAVLDSYQLTEEALRAPGQNRRCSEARALAAWAVLELSDATLNELAARVNRDASSLSAAIKRLRTKALADPQIEQQMQALRRGLEVSVFQTLVRQSSRPQSCT